MARTSMETRRLFAVALVGAIALLAAACDRNESVDSLSATYGLPSNEVDIQAEDWVLVPAKGTVPVPAGEPVTLSVDDGKVSGQGPCNGYHGKIELGDDDSVTISKIGATLKSCGDRVDRAEQRFFAALEAVDTIDVSDEELELSNGETLVFEPQ